MAHEGEGQRDSDRGGEQRGDGRQLEAELQRLEPLRREGLAPPAKGKSRPPW
jgi:hypothetical protein